ncbi:hypothetical protein C1646_674110 [Rhizophagus diaphanus]|nr:hypothetical protein C1646_674110 [Rhizophagus diaphanus] [Rhizophagus sp. MUCL 43196]
MLLTATCTTSDVEDIWQNLNILPTNFTIIRGTSLARQEIDIQVVSKPSKQNLYSHIQNILVGLITGRCVIYYSGPGSCQELFHYLHENLPALSFANFIQEIGRAGRDGKPSKNDLCVKGFLILNFQLRKTAALTKNFSFKPIIVGLGDNAEEEVTRITWQYFFKQ